MGLTTWRDFYIMFELVLNVIFKYPLFFSDRRLADHFGGKLHLGYMQIREKLAELQVSSEALSLGSKFSRYFLCSVFILVPRSIILFGYNTVKLYFKNVILRACYIFCAMYLSCNANCCLGARIVSLFFFEKFSNICYLWVF